MEEVKQFLIDQERFDLVAILICAFEELDDDYEPPLDVKEPREEYIEEGDPEEADVGITKDGFYYLK
tara:strand:- start:512 stop:712 length:201 start_codon:yes stop_codon:yes gene_type:complete